MLDAQAAAMAAQQKALDDAKAAAEKAEADKAEAARREQVAKDEAARIAALPKPEPVAEPLPETVLVAVKPSKAAEPAVAVEVESDSTPDAVDLFGTAPAVAPLAVDPVALLTNCQDALREALQIVQQLVNDMDQTKDKAARVILARVAELRDLGGI